MSKTVNPLHSHLHIDRLIHEPARLIILGMLSVVAEADFLFLMKTAELTRGNLSSHMTKLETAGYIEVRKEFAGKTPRTVLSITPVGKAALDLYRKKMKAVLKAL